MILNNILNHWVSVSTTRAYIHTHTHTHNRSIIKQRQRTVIWLWNLVEKEGWGEGSNKNKFKNSNTGWHEMFTVGYKVHKKSKNCTTIQSSTLRDSSVGLVTRQRAGRSGDRIPVRARFYVTVQTGPGAHPASYTMGTGSFPGVKRPELGVDRPPASSAEVGGRVELYICSPSGPSWPVIGWALPLTLIQRSFLWPMLIMLMWAVTVSSRLNCKQNLRRPYLDTHFFSFFFVLSIYSIFYWTDYTRGATHFPKS